MDIYMILAAVSILDIIGLGFCAVAILGINF